MSSSWARRMGRALEVCAAQGTARRAPWACDAHVSSPEATSPEKAASIGVEPGAAARGHFQMFAGVRHPSKKRTGLGLGLAHVFPFAMVIFTLSTSIRQLMRETSLCAAFCIS